MASPTSSTVDLLDTAGKASTGATASSPNMVQIVLSIIGVALSLMGLIFLCLILYAGYNYMTAGGDDSKIDTAKQTITRGVIGLIIVLCSYAILQFVVPALLCATGVGDMCPLF